MDYEQTKLKQYCQHQDRHLSLYPEVITFCSSKSESAVVNKGMYESIVINSFFNKCVFVYLVEKNVSSCIVKQFVLSVFVR